MANLSLSYWSAKSNPGWWEPVDVAYSVAVRAANYAQQHGTLVVAAAGNDPINFDGEGNWVQFPVDLPGVIGVSATAPNECWAYDPTVDLDWPAPYTSYGQRVIDLAAPGGNLDFALVRYMAGGVLDASFGTGGKVTTDFGGGDDSASSVAVQSDGKIVMAGRSGNNFAVVRYAADGGQGDPAGPAMTRVRRGAEDGL